MSGARAQATMTRLHNNQRPRSTPSSTPAGPAGQLINAIHHAPRHSPSGVWQAIPGTPLDMPQEGGVHHIGYWVDNLPGRGEPARHARLPSYATAGTTPLLNRGPSGTLIELCDLHSDRPPMPWHPSTAHVRSGHRQAGHRYFKQDKPLLSLSQLSGSTRPAQAK